MRRFRRIIPPIAVGMTSVTSPQFRSAARRMIASIGIFTIPVVVYFLAARKRFVNNDEPYAFVWGACYVVSLLFLAAGLTTLIRDANRERRTGFYRFRR